MIIIEILHLVDFYMSKSQHSGHCDLYVVKQIVNICNYLPSHLIIKVMYVIIIIV